MKRRWFLWGMALILLSFSECSPKALRGDRITCRITTSLGTIDIRVFHKKAPITAANFLHYVNAGFYNGSTFFRVVRKNNQPSDRYRIEVVQGGDLPDEKCFPPISHEPTSETGLRHKDGAVSMARAAPGTAQCSFFICIGSQPELDFGGRRNPDGLGFAAFGQVVEGMDIVRRIHAMETDGQFLREPVRIESVVRLAKGDEIEGVFGSGYRGRWTDIPQAAFFAFRSLPLHYQILFVVLLLVAILVIWRLTSGLSGSHNIAGTVLRVVIVILGITLLAVFTLIIAGG